MIKPIALIKVSRLNTPNDLAAIRHQMQEHTMSSDYHMLIAPCLDNNDVQLEIHNDNEASETTVEELRKHIETLINETK